MIVNTPVQDPLIDKAKAEKFLIDMYAQNGKVLTQSEAANHVNNKHFKKLLPSLHLESGSGMADEAKIEMIYTSLLKPVEDPPQINNKLPENPNKFTIIFDTPEGNEINNLFFPIRFNNFFKISFIFITSFPIHSIVIDLTSFDIIW